MNTLTLPHEELMQEENLKYSDLPDDIREDVNDFEELKSEYKEYPSESGKNQLIRESVAIADTIQDWIERDLPNSDDSDDNIVENKNNQASSEFKPTWKFW